MAMSRKEANIRKMIAMYRNELNSQERSLRRSLDRHEITQNRYKRNLKSLREEMRMKTMKLLDSSKLTILEAIDLLFTPRSSIYDTSNDIIGDFVAIMIPKEEVYDN